MCKKAIFAIKLDFMRISLVMVSPGAGGLQQSIIPYAQALKGLGHPVQLVMHAASPLLDEARQLGFEPEPVTGPHQFPFLQGFRAREYLMRFAPDGVIGFAGKGYPLARLAAPRGVSVFTRVGTMNAQRMRKLLTADGLIVTSAEMRDLALSLGAQEKRVVVVPNFLCARTPPAKAHNSVPRIGAMGRFMHRKGFDILLRAAALLRAQGRIFELVIAGAGPELANLRRLAAQIDIPIEFAGWIANDAKAAFFQELDVFACPSRDEPFGQIFLEAMQAGVPVVATDTVGARCIFTNGHDGLIARGEDPEHLAETLARLLDNPLQREALAAAASASFARQYHTGVQGARLSEALLALIQSQS